MYFFSSSNIYFAEKEHIKIIFLRLSSAWVKIHLITHVNFEMTSRFNSSSNFASFFIFMTHNCSVDFKLILFLLWIKGSHHYPNFETLNCSGENFLYSLSCSKPQVSFSSNFASPLSVMKDNSSESF